MHPLAMALVLKKDWEQRAQQLSTQMGLAHVGADGCP